MNSINYKLKFAPVVLAFIFLSLFTEAMAQDNQDNMDRISFSRLPDLPQASGGQMAGVSDKALLVIGGSYFNVPVWDGGTKLWLDTILALEPGAKEWKLAGRLGSPLGYGAAVSVDDGVIVVGGSDGLRHYADVFRLRWHQGKLEKTALPALPQPAANVGAAVIGKTIYVMGGQSAPAAVEAMKTLFALDLNEREPKWKTLEPLPGAARILPVVAAQSGAVYWDGSMVITGGEDRPGHRSASVWRGALNANKTSFGVINYLILIGYLGVNLLIGIVLAKRQKDTNDYLSVVSDLNVYFCILTMGLLATIYTIFGGAEAVTWTEVLQNIILLGSAVLSVARLLA